MHDEWFKKHFSYALLIITQYKIDYQQNKPPCHKIVLYDALVKRSERRKK